MSGSWLKFLPVFQAIPDAEQTRRAAVLDSRFEMAQNRVKTKDRVKTKSGREGVVTSVVRDVANIRWEDGEVFGIRCCHLEVIPHTKELPTKI